MKRIPTCLLAGILCATTVVAYAQQSTSSNELMMTYAIDFLDRPYVAGTLEQAGDEQLVVNCDEVDCTTFVEYVLAMAMATAPDGTLTEEDFVTCLKRVRYRDGKIDGYTSRLHYFTDWIYNGVRNGFLEDVTSHVSLVKQTIDVSYMTRHPQEYPALAHSADNIGKMRDIEATLSGKEVAYLRTEDIPEEGWPWIKNGDIIAITTNREGLDVAHVGIAFYADGKLGLLHASSSEGKVMVSNYSLRRLLANNRYWTGIRVVRLKK